MEELKEYYCSNCGFLVGKKDSYCRRCGHKIFILNMKEIDDTSYICESCRNIITLGKRFCSRCGTRINWNNYIKLENDEHLCYECGYINKKENNYCSRCGTKFDLHYIFPDNSEITCSKCGSTNSINSNYCTKCGMYLLEIKEKSEQKLLLNGENKSLDNNLNPSLNKNDEKHLSIEEYEKTANDLMPLEIDILNSTYEINNNLESMIQENIEKVKEIIETLFKEINFCYVTESKILGRLITFDENLVKKLNLNINNIKEFMEDNYDDYFFAHPFVGKEEIISPRKMVVKYFKSKNIINHKMILDFFDSIGYSNHKSYKIYFDELVLNGFYRINDEVVVTNDSLVIDESTLESIKSNLGYYFENTYVMNTSKLSRYYFMLPKIKYTWNSHVLIFVIKKYFSDEYIITENSDGRNYTIRRK